MLIELKVLLFRQVRVALIAIAYANDLAHLNCGQS